MSITPGSRFSSLIEWTTSLDSFSRVQFNDAFAQLDSRAAGWTETNGAASGTLSGFFHYNTDDAAGLDGTLEVYADAGWVLLRDGYEMRSSTVNAKGDLLAGTADNTVARVGIGADGRVLSADASAASGMVWNTTVSSLLGTANEVEVSASSGAITIGLPSAVTISTLTIDSVGISTIQTGLESFADNDTSVMTSAAVQDKILAYGYSTLTGTIPISLIDAKGDLLVGSADDTAVKVGVGADGRVLSADASAASGMVWNTTVSSLSGTAAQISVSAASGAIAIGLPNDVTIAGTLTVDSVGIAAVQTSVESFVDNNTSIMTSGAIADKIEDYGYVTSAAAISSVTGTTNEVSAFTSSGAVTVGLPDDVTITGTLTVDSVGISNVDSGSGFTDNDVSLMTSGAIKDKIENYGYASVAQLNAFQTTIDDVETQFYMEVMV